MINRRLGKIFSKHLCQRYQFIKDSHNNSKYEFSYFNMGAYVFVYAFQIQVNKCTIKVIKTCSTKITALLNNSIIHLIFLKYCDTCHTNLT